MSTFLLERGGSWPQPVAEVFTGGQSAELQQATLDKSENRVIAQSLGREPLKQSIVTNESDPNGKSSKEPGSKLDAGKVDVLRGAITYFPRALTAVADVSERGAKKYSWKGWETVPNGIERYGAALGRHLLFDPFATDDGLGGLGLSVLHAAQVAWNALARLELILRELDGQRTSDT